MTATSTEQRTDNSCAFLNKPPFRLRKVLIRALLVNVYANDGTASRVDESRRTCYLHRSVPVIFDRFDLNLPATHGCLSGSNVNAHACVGVEKQFGSEWERVSMVVLMESVALNSKSDGSFWRFRPTSVAALLMRACICNCLLRRTTVCVTFAALSCTEFRRET
jgi:hypothetical protein